VRTVLALALACTTACGRFGFDATGGDDIGVDAAMGDAPPTDGPAATTRCNEGPTLFCDGFETGTLDAWRGDIGAGTLGISNDMPFMGGFAMRAQAGVGGFAYGAVDLAPITDGEIYVRLHMRIPAGIPIAPPEVQLFRVGRETDNGHVHFMVDANDRPIVWSEFDLLTGTGTVPRDRWLCMTAHLVLGASGSADFAIDDVPVVGIPSGDISPRDGGFDEVSVGMVSTDNAQAQLQILVDEVAIARTPLPCGP
jgi:hypothetical protein